MSVKNKQFHDMLQSVVYFYLAYNLKKNRGFVAVFCLLYCMFISSKGAFCSSIVMVVGGRAIMRPRPISSPKTTPKFIFVKTRGFGRG